ITPRVLRSGPDHLHGHRRRVERGHVEQGGSCVEVPLARTLVTVEEGPVGATEGPWLPVAALVQEVVVIFGLEEDAPGGGVSHSNGVGENLAGMFVRCERPALADANGGDQ